MIKEHQPTIFDNSVKVVFSSREDGSMAVGSGQPPTEEHLQKRQQFLQSNGYDPANATLLFVPYTKGRSFVDIVRVTSENKGQDIQADAIYTTEPNIPLMLPVADCIATVIFDPVMRMLAILHLGRDASFAGLSDKFVTEARAQANSDSGNWKVWMSPSLQLPSNHLHTFEPPDKEDWAQYNTPYPNGVLVDFPSHETDHLIKQGVYAENLEVSNVNTFTDANYFSHRAATEGEMPDKQGRMIVVAMMTAPGETAA